LFHSMNIAESSDSVVIYKELLLKDEVSRLFSKRK